MKQPEAQAPLAFPLGVSVALVFAIVAVDALSTTGLAVSTALAAALIAGNRLWAAVRGKRVLAAAAWAVGIVGVTQAVITVV